MSIKDAIHLYITVSRWEFLPAVFIGIFIGILVGADSLQSLFAFSFLPYLVEGLFIFILLFNVGFMVNCWADWKVDELYKTKLYQAVVGLGRQNLGILVIVHIILAILLALHLSIALNRIEISILVWIGTFLGVAYSVEPFRFKRRGLLHSLVALPIFFIPGVYSYFLVSSLQITDLYSLSFILLAIGITIGHYALILVSQAEDLPADKKMHLFTPAVKWGLHKTIKYSLLLNIFGSILATISLTIIFTFLNVWLLLLLPIIIISRYFSFNEVYKLVKRSKIFIKEAAFLAELRKKMDTYPLWHAYGLTGITISGLSILLIKTLNWLQPL